MDVVHFVSVVVVVLHVDLFCASWKATTSWEAVGGGIVIPPLKWDAARVKAFVFESDDLLVAFLLEHDARVTPGEVVLLPEREDGEHERVDREGEDIDDHPAYMLPLSSKDENQSL